MKKGFRYNAIEFRLILDAMFGMTRKEIQKLLKSDITLIELAAAQQMMNAAAGDIKAFDFALDRSIGKVKEKVEVQGPRPTVIRRKNGDTVELGASLGLDKELDKSEE